MDARSGNRSSRGTCLFSRRLHQLVAFGTLGALALACGSARTNAFEETDPTTPAGGDLAPANPGGGSLGTGGGPGSGPGDQTCAANVQNATRAEVDIIIAIDTSGSMGEETAQVQANINDFAKSIGGSGLDYRVTMIAEKPTAPPIPLPIPIPPTGICVDPPLGGANCTENLPLYHHLVKTVSSTDAFDVILAQYPTYSAWLRPTAYKVFIVITDDYSNPTTYQQFDQQLLAKSATQFGTAANRRYIFNSICGWKRGTPILSGTKCGSAVNTGSQYQELSQLTNGTIDSVCETSYASVFQNIAKGLVTKLGCEFSFPKAQGGGTTDPEKVVVNYTSGAGGAAKPLTRVTDQSKCGTIADAWYYDDNNNPTKIVFCPSTCSGPGADTGGKIDIAVGCKAPPPK